jgi:hypothetical protein
MAQLPRSLHATPGMLAEGDAGRVADDHPELAGLQMATAARTAAIEKVRPPCFGYMTVQNKKNEKKGWLGEKERGAALLLALLHEPGRPHLVLMVFVWLGDKSDLLKYFDMKNIVASDRKLTGINFSKMAHECVALPTWSEHGAFALFEPTIKVLRSSAGDNDDPETITLKYVMIKHAWKSPKHGWLRLHTIEEATGVKEWGVRDLIALFPADLRALVPDISPAPPSGLVPTTPSFPAIARDVMYIGEFVYRIGGCVVVRLAVCLRRKLLLSGESLWSKLFTSFRQHVRWRREFCIHTVHAHNRLLRLWHEMPARRSLSLMTDRLLACSKPAR